MGGGRCAWRHAAVPQVGEYLIETLARVPVEVEYASEFRYRNPILSKEDVVVAISQSGETADTLAALQLARGRGCLCLGMCNVVGSTIARETNAGARRALWQSAAPNGSGGSLARGSMANAEGAHGSRGGAGEEPPL